MLEEFKEKTVAITGATGLIGTHLVNKLITFDNTRIVCIGRNKSKLENVFKDFLANDRLSFVECDVADKFPNICENVDYIFHAASPIAGEIIREQPVSVIKPNIMGTFNCLDYLKKQGKGRMVVFSSATVYANTTTSDFIASEDKTSIADTLDATNAPYSESKRLCEVMAKAYYKEHGVETLIARFSYMYGYTNQMPNTAFYEFIKRIIAGEDIILNNAGMPRRDNIFIDDAVNGLLTLCTNGKVGESYNVSSGGDNGNFAAIDEIAQIMADVAYELRSNKRSAIIYKSKPCERKAGLILNNDKLKALGWKVNNSLRDGICQTMKAYLN